MSETTKGKEPTIESLTAERDKLKGDLEATNRAKIAAERERDEAQAALAQKIADFDSCYRTLEETRNELGQALIDATDAEGPGLTLPDLTTPEVDGKPGVRSYGRDASPEAFVHVERISFAQDLGYQPSTIHRRAAAAVKRALSDTGHASGETSENALPSGLPAFGPERTLTVVVEIG